MDNVTERLKTHVPYTSKFILSHHWYHSLW